MPAAIYLRFYEELNDYLPPGQRKRALSYPIGGTTSVGQILQTLGVPDSEVELVLVNGSSVNLSFIFAPGDLVSIYPVFESLDVKPLLRIRKKPLRQTRFIAAPGLRRLTSLLRSLGFDVVVESQGCLAEEERRILLTTDAARLKSGLTRVCVVRETVPERQLKEVLSRLDLFGADESRSGAPT